MRRTLSPLCFSLALAATAVLASSWFTDSCACVTVPPTRQDRWIGLTPLRDSLDLTLMSAVRSIGGTGVVRPQAGAPRSVTLDGSADDDTAFLPSGMMPGDTLGLFLRRVPR